MSHPYCCEFCGEDSKAEVCQPCGDFVVQLSYRSAYKRRKFEERLERQQQLATLLT